VPQAPQDHAGQGGARVTCQQQRDAGPASVHESHPLDDALVTVTAPALHPTARAPPQLGGWAPVRAQGLP
jgi:hypothetical protein